MKKSKKSDAKSGRKKTTCFLVKKKKSNFPGKIHLKTWLKKRKIGNILM